MQRITANLFLSARQSASAPQHLRRRAEKAGFVNLDKGNRRSIQQLKAGDRVYANNMGKGMALFVIGKESMEKGMNILGAHIDSPRLDLKQDPLYEDTDFAMLDTHYYGGIKKYQWVTLTFGITWCYCKKRRNCCKGKCRR